MAFVPAANVEGVPRQPLPYGLFTAFALREAGDGRWQAGVDWTSITCDPAGGVGDPDCVDDSNPSFPTTPDRSMGVGLPKEFAAPITSEASPFTVYGSYVCSPTAGQDPQEMAREHLLTREEARVEQALWTGDLGNVPNMAGANGYPDPTILGDQPSYTAKHALVLVEDFLATHYGSLGVIHMSRGTALALTDEGMIEAKNNRLFTKVGTPVVAGAGYAGDRIVGTPALLGYRSEVFEATDVPGDLLDRGSNDLYGIAERNYVIGWDDCGVGVALLADTAGGSTTAGEPVISYPSDSATVPAVHDVLGYALPGQTVHLWSAANEGTMKVHATVTADERGHFAFTGAQADGPDGTVAHFQVTTATGVSDMVSVTVDTSLTVTPPTITYPTDGAVVPAVHDVSGTALPSQEVRLYSASGQGSLKWHATTYADDTGKFMFAGSQPTGKPGTTAHFQVVTADGESEIVTVTVES